MELYLTENTHNGIMDKKVKRFILWRIKGLT
jgi:hypothetical protein